MVGYKKVYLDYFELNEGLFVPCEISGQAAVDISHNYARGMGSSKQRDNIENLMALTRQWHMLLEMNASYRWWFQLVHYRYMITKVPYHQDPLSSEDPIFNQLIQKL